MPLRRPPSIEKGAFLVAELLAEHVNLTGARRVEWFEFQLDAVVFAEAFLDESGVDGADEGSWAFVVDHKWAAV